MAPDGKQSDWKKIKVSSTFGHKHKAAFVEIDISEFPRDHPLQMHIEDARHLALNLLQAAEAAEQDAFLFSFARNMIGTDERGAAMVMKAYRDYRDETRGK